MSNDRAYAISVEQEVIRALGCDELDFNGLLARLKGAQQQQVEPILKTLVDSKTIIQTGLRFKLSHPPPRPDWANTRARVIGLLSGLPPSNPLAAQWWFNFDSAVWLAERVWESHWGKRVAFLGTPVVGFAYAVATNQPCVIVEFDRDVVAAVQAKLAAAQEDGSAPCDVLVHDAFERLPIRYHGCFAGIVCDPPWYEDYFVSFLSRCLELGQDDGIVYWSVIPLLTRPQAETQRTESLNRLASIGCSILALDSAKLVYVVPEFEAEAYRHIPAFHSKVWRRSDLLVFRLPPISRRTEALTSASRRPIQNKAKSYYDAKRAIRLFHLPERENENLATPYEEDVAFSSTVSLAEHPIEHIALWSSRRRGFALSKLPALPLALALWSEGKLIAEIREALQAKGGDSKEPSVSHVIDLLEAITTEEEEKPKIIRRRDKLRKMEIASLNEAWATLEHHRERDALPDPYRLEFQRDRDKILWAKAFRKLASKTQVFPNFGDDRFRSRLTHTLEVCQIGRTLARAFGLNEDLTEAIAFAHDIGHTPFGHAGEEAINDFLCETINKSCCETKRRTTWFSHYEHGVDVLRWLEDIYFSPGTGKAVGLGVSIEVYDGVFKHMYHRHMKTGDRRNNKSQEELYSYSKHRKLIKDGYARLEGQAVRIADKICYLVQDIEDGILAGVITLADLSECRLFSRPYIDLVQAPDETQLHRYLSQRGEIINILTKDTLEHTQETLRKLGGWGEFDNHDDYVLRPSDEIMQDISEVWSKVQAGILHKHPKVVGANARASRIIKTLMMLFTFCPRLVEDSFRHYFELLNKETEHVAAYVEAVGSDRVAISKEAGSYFDAALAKDRKIESSYYEYKVPLHNVIQAQDYVASMTDGEAMQFYRNYSQAGIGGSPF